MAGVAALASALGPVLGGLMVDLGGWRLVFLVNLPIGLAALVARAAHARAAAARRRPSRPDLLGSLLAVAAVGTLALGAVQGPVWGWGDPRTIAAFAASALLAPVLVWRSAVHPAPVLELALFRVRSFSAGNLGALLLGTSFFGLVLANSLYLTQVWDYSVLRAGLAIAPGPLASAAAAILPARFTDRIDPRRFVLPGAVISAVAGVWLATRVGAEPAFVAEWLPGMLLMGTGSGSGFATTVAVCVRDLGPAQLGIGSGMSSTTRQLGAVLGVAILIAILGPAPGPGSYDSGWWAMAGARAGRRRARGADRAAAGLTARPARAGARSAILRASVAAVAGRSSPNASRRPSRARTRSVATRRRGRRSACSAASIAANGSVWTRAVTASSSSHSRRRSLAASSASGLAHVVAGVTSQTFSLRVERRRAARGRARGGSPAGARRHGASGAEAAARRRGAASRRRRAAGRRRS